MIAKWPARPVEGTVCEAIVDYHTGNSGPEVVRCAEPATESAKWAGANAMLRSVPQLCAGCAERLEDRGLIRRNPRLRRKPTEAGPGEG